MSFQRARSAEQREVRRQAILDTASAMLAEMPVADLSLNELARRVGLAKSNVLRYFDSREAVLLELLVAATGEYVEAVAASTGDLVDVVVSALETRPVLCDLIGAQAAVLERNISAEVAADFKRSMFALAGDFAKVVQRRAPALDDESVFKFVAVTLLSAGAVWAHTQPSKAMQEAYARHPDLAAMRLDYGATMRELLTVFLRGLLVT